MADIDGAFELLENYLRQIGVSEADGVIFCADGDRRYWKRFSSLAETLEVKECFQVIDYTHAKQDLHLVAEHLPKTLEPKERTAILKDWKDLLWQRSNSLCQGRLYFSRINLDGAVISRNYKLLPQYKML